MSCFHERLRVLCRIRQKGLGELALATGLPLSRVRDLMDGTEEPKLSEIQALARALNISLSSLTGVSTCVPALCQTCGGHGIVWSAPPRGSVLRHSELKEA